MQVAMILIVIHVGRSFCALGDQCMDNLIGQGLNGDQDGANGENEAQHIA